MNVLRSTEQVSEGSIADIPFDLALFATGFEQRATHVLSRKLGRLAKVKYAFGYYDRVDDQRRANDALFAAGGFKIHETNGDVGDEVRLLTRRALESNDGELARIVVDYSSMTRAWLAAVIQALRIAHKSSIECYFCYSPSCFSPPAEVAPNASVGPVQGFSSLDSTERPTALILGLGYEKERALGLKEYVDPAATYAFYTEPALDASFTDAVLTNNAALLNALPAEHRFRHPLADLQYTGQLLTGLCSALQNDYRIILAPMGVKPFALQCLLIAARYPEIDVWRVSAGSRRDPEARPAYGPVLILKAVFNAVQSTTTVASY